MAILQDCSSQPLHVSSAEITAHVSWPLALDAARRSALARTGGDVECKRATLNFKNGWMRLMAADIPSMGIFGYKEFHLAENKSVRYCIYVFVAATGEPVGIVDAALVTTLRTAATAAIAVEQIVGQGTPVRLGVVGSGAEALAGVEALSHVLKLDHVSVTSRSEVNMAGFVAQVQERTGLVAEAHSNVAHALNGVDVVYSATNSGGHVVLQASDVADIPVVASIGSTLPSQRELSGEILLAADRIVVDTPEVFEESGDALEAIAQGLDANSAELLGVALQNHATPNRKQKTVYKSIGSPEQDIILAAMILESASSGGFGRHVDPLSAVKVNL